MRRRDFEFLVKKALKRLPPHIKKFLENVEIVVEDWPNEQIIKKLKLPGKYSLLGLYQGIPKTKRGGNYANVLPDKITLFQRPIENIAKSDKGIEETVQRVVWHEIAHHFGFNEDKIRELEKKKFKK